MTEAGIRVMWPRAKGSWRLPEPGGGSEAWPLGYESPFQSFSLHPPMWCLGTGVTQTLQMMVGQAGLPETVRADWRPLIVTADPACWLQTIHVGYDHAW